MYSRVNHITQANHLLVKGKDGNIEIVEVQDMTNKI